MSRPDIVQCQGCHGAGGSVDRILDDGSGPWEPCGYCAGTGRTTKMMNAWIMRWAAVGHWTPSDADEDLHSATMQDAQLSAAGGPGAEG